MEIIFILYKPAVPGNVGAAARALKTMGFSRMRLIDPCNHLGEEARMLAHASHEVLEQAEVFATFEKAAADLDMVVCTTAKGRSAKHEYHSSKDLTKLLEERSAHLQRVGILFGTEESGLPNRLILHSDLAVSIPMHTTYPSLNLGQSVMIMAYELSVLNELQKPGEVLQKTGEGYGALKARTVEILDDAGIPRDSPLHHRIIERLALTGPTDIPLLLSVISRIPRF